MTLSSQSSIPRRTAAFSLVEMLVVVLILSVLLGIGMSIMGNERGKALRAGADQLSSMIEQGRTTAITRRKPVVLALLEPGNGGFDDGLCRLGLFELEKLPAAGGIYSGNLLQRWHLMPGGLAFFGGQVDSLNNFRDEAAINLEWKNGSESATVHALVFGVRGGLMQPAGSESVVLTIGNGTYRNGSPVRTSKSGSQSIRVGRVVARPWNLEA